MRNKRERESRELRAGHDGAVLRQKQRPRPQAEIEGARRKSNDRRCLALQLHDVVASLGRVRGAEARVHGV
jgi:hypothetical protein